MGTINTRQKLTEAIATATSSREAFESAERILAVAQASVEGAHAAIAEFEGLDEAIAAARLAALKGDASRRLQDLISRQRDRLLAKEELAAAESTLELARVEMESARKAAGERQRAIGTAVIAILSEHVQTVEAELEKLEKRRRSLLAFLTGLALTPVGWEYLEPGARDATVARWVENAGFPLAEAGAWSQLIVGILAKLRESGSPRPEAPGPSMPLWKSFAEAVLQDPTVEAPPLP